MSSPPPPTASLLHSAFYRFVPLADPSAAADALRACAGGLRGSIVVAHEGVSGTVAGEPRAVAAFETALQRTDLLAGALRGMPFRHSACTTAPFGRLKVGVKPEIVALGLPAADLPLPDERDASRLSPAAWRELLSRGDAVLLDNRNHFEYRLGHFRGAIDPGVGHFRDLVAYVEAEAPAWRAAGRPVAMYCTGGIRCDKTAPWLRSLGLDVRQLDGGILNYFQAFPGEVVETGTDTASDADTGTGTGADTDTDTDTDTDRLWQGECFVFDNRIALDTRLRETDTTPEQVFDAADPGEAWRLRRARRLAG